MDKLISQLPLILTYVTPVFIILLSFIAGKIFNKYFITWLERIVQNTSWQGDDLIVNSLKSISIFWFLLGGIALSTTTMPLSPTLLIVINKVILGIFLASVTLVIANISVGLIRLFSSQKDSSAVLTTLFETITKLVIFVLGTLIILQSVGVAITPLLTAVSVGGFSLGLALQHPISNLISGIGIITSKKIRPGDYIKLNTGEEGYVTDVELKYTVIRDITDNLLIIPNAQLISSSFINYGLPSKQMLITIKVGVSYDSDLQEVEKVTIEVAKEVMEHVEGGVPDYHPFMRYNKFDYFSIDFTIYLAIREYYDQLVIQHEFIKRLHKRYQQEGIKIPFPVQNVELSLQGQNDELKTSLPER